MLLANQVKLVSVLSHLFYCFSLPTPWHLKSKYLFLVKGSILKILGVLSEHFPDALRDRASNILPLMVESLNKEFKSQKPEMQVIAGAMRGLSSFLINFGAEFTSSAKNLQMLYRYLTLALEPLPNVNRYDIPKGVLLLLLLLLFFKVLTNTLIKAGLKLLATHANVFRQYLTEDSQKMYGRVSPLCVHQNKKLRDHALAALDAFLGQVSNELVSTQRDPESNRETFKVQPKKVLLT